MAANSKKLKPPAHVTGAAKCEWKRIIAELKKQGELNHTDLALIASYATAFGRWIDAESEVAKAGVVVKTKSGNFIQNPFLGVANTSMKLTNRFARELGFSPLIRQEVRNRGRKPAYDILENLDLDDAEEQAETHSGPHAIPPTKP